MNVSRAEQRALHALAQGGAILVEKNEQGRITTVRCYTRDGHVLSAVTLGLFKKLKAKRAIASVDGRPYRISRNGLDLVRAQLDNR
jgi:uncharacterized protein YjhX (UPF0386 family)